MENDYVTIKNDYVTVGIVQAPVYVSGRIFPMRNLDEMVKALEDLERSGLVALTGPTGAQARIVAPFDDKIWYKFFTLTGIYNITDHKGRFGRKRAKVNVVAHGLGHPLSSSQRIKKATKYMSQLKTFQLNKDEEIKLLSKKGTPIFTYDNFLEASQDPQFLKANPNFRVVRTQDVLNRTTHGEQLLSDWCDNSSALCCFGGKNPVKVTTPQGEEKTVTITQALIDKTGQKFNIGEPGQIFYKTKLNLSKELHHEGKGGRMLIFYGYFYNSCYTWFVGVNTGGARKIETIIDYESRRSKVVPSLEQVSALGKNFVSYDARPRFEKKVWYLYPTIFLRD